MFSAALAMEYGVDSWTLYLAAISVSAMPVEITITLLSFFCSDPAAARRRGRYALNRWMLPSVLMVKFLVYSAVSVSGS